MLYSFTGGSLGTLAGMLAPLPPTSIGQVAAHRGARLEATENTPEAFRTAASLGAHGVELDVRRSAEGAVVVHHDPVVPGLGPVVESSVPDLATAGVVTLDDALAACTGMWVNIEVKNSPVEPDWDPDDRLARQVAKMADEAGLAGSVVISSFNPAALLAVADQAASLRTALLVSGWRMRDAAMSAVELGAWALHAADDMVKAPADEVAFAEEMGLRVGVWTVNEVERALALAEAGCYAIFTDDPRKIVPALTAR